MPRKKPGDKKTGGRKKGTPNKLTRTVKETFLQAFNELQEDPKVNLVSWGKRSPNAFYQVASKLIPLEIKGELKTKVIEQITGFKTKDGNRDKPKSEAAASS